MTKADHQVLLWALEEVVLRSPIYKGQKPVLFELGTHHAGTTKAICEALIILEQTDRCEFITCDLHFFNTDSRGRNGFYPIDEFRRVIGELEERFPDVRVPARMIEDMGAAIAGSVPDPLVWCFLDGCHCRECVEAELAAYGPRIARGGFLLLHDCTEEYRNYPPDQPYHGGTLRPFEVIEVVEEWEAENEDFVHVATTPAKAMKNGKFFGGTRVMMRKF